MSREDRVVRSGEFKAVREALSLTVAAMAELLAVSEWTVKNWEKGTTARARESGVRARGSGRPGTARRRHPLVASRVRGGGADPIVAGRPVRIPSAPLRKDAT